MCFNKQPAAPIEKPSYAPEDAHKHFKVTQEDEASGEKKVLNEPASKDGQGRLNIMHDNIRM